MQVVLAGMPESEVFFFLAIDALKKICNYVVGTEEILSCAADLRLCGTGQKHNVPIEQTNQ